MKKQNIKSIIRDYEKELKERKAYFEFTFQSNSYAKNNKLRGSIIQLEKFISTLKSLEPSKGQKLFGNCYLTLAILTVIILSLLIR